MTSTITEIQPVASSTDVTGAAPADGVEGGHVAELRAVYVGTRSERRARLQGWRGADLEAAVRAGWLRSLAPAVCGVGALAAAVTSSAWLATALLVTAVVGVVAPHHPVESLANAIACRTGRPTLPANRAAKRSGCAIGSLHLAGGAVAIWAGATTVATVLLGSLGVLALFVAVTGICIPSVMYTLQFGARRATAARLLG